MFSVSDIQAGKSATHPVNDWLNFAKWYDNEYKPLVDPKDTTADGFNQFLLEGGGAVGAGTRYADVDPLTYKMYTQYYNPETEKLGYKLFTQYRREKPEDFVSVPKAYYAFLLNYLNAVQNFQARHSTAPTPPTNSRKRRTVGGTTRPGGRGGEKPVNIEDIISAIEAYYAELQKNLNA